MSNKKPKQKIITCKLNRSFPKNLDEIIELGIPIEVGLGKYSSYVVNKLSNNKYKFLTKMQSKKTFIGYSKILKDLKRDCISVVLSDLEDNIEEKNNMYYGLGKYQTISYENAVCVDLNSAYLQALFNLTLITSETKIWIEQNLSKTERLVAVGMLAKQKEILEFNEGKLISSKKEDAKNRFIFNAVIQEVAAVMNKIYTNHLDDFISYWVDGIYLKNEYMAMNIVEEFEAAGFPCKIEYLTNFKAKFKYDHMEYTYNKDGKFKLLNIPIASVHDERRKNVLSLINSKRLDSLLDVLPTDFFETKSYEQARLF